MTLPLTRTRSFMKKMEQTVYLLYASLLCCVNGEQLEHVSQPNSFQAVSLGDSVTIPCNIISEARERVWYKLTTGKTLQLLAWVDSFYNIVTIRKTSAHLSVKSDKFNFHLIISETTREDAGTYFCGVKILRDVQFGQGTSLIIKGVTSHLVVQRPESQSVRIGGNVTLSCSVRSGQCGSEHCDVTWLKSSVEIIHSSGFENGSCQETEGGKATCVHHLTLWNLTSYHAGSYYCVVNLCGQLLFGNGTMINIQGEVPLTRSFGLSPTVLALTLTNSFLVLVVLLLLWRVCKSDKKDSTASTRSSEDHPADSQTTSTVVYAAVSSASRVSSRSTGN